MDADREKGRLGIPFDLVEQEVLCFVDPPFQEQPAHAIAEKIAFGKAALLVHNLEHLFLFLQKHLPQHPAQVLNHPQDIIVVVHPPRSFPVRPPGRPPDR